MNRIERNQNLDMLRLVAMFCIVSMHYFGWGGLASAKNTTIVNLAFGGGVAVATNCGVNCFYLISGYFIKQGESFEGCKRRILKVYLPTLFYSVVIPGLLVWIGEITLSGKQVVMTFLPFLSNQYWFTTCFIAMTALLPFIAVMLNNITDSMLIRLMVVMVIIDSIQPILGFNAFSNIGYGIVHAFTMYIIGYTIRRKAWRVKNYITISVFIVAVGLIGLITILSIKMTGDRNRTIADYNSILMIIQSVALFMFFLNLKVTYDFSKFSPYIFGIYLLNDNQYARTFLWKKIFHCEAFYTSKLLPLHYLVTVMVFMIGALTIEWIRINSWKVIKQIKGK